MTARHEKYPATRHRGPGFYFNNACTVFAMYAFLYLQLWSHTLELDHKVCQHCMPGLQDQEALLCRDAPLAAQHPHTRVNADTRLHTSTL